jgi:hypothetical protein
MNVEVIKAFGHWLPGDIVEGLPDGSVVDTEYFKVIEADDPPIVVDDKENDELAGNEPVNDKEDEN